MIRLVVRIAAIVIVLGLIIAGFATGFIPGLWEASQQILSMPIGDIFSEHGDKLLYAVLPVIGIAAFVLVLTDM